jgi:hypothetical protein
VVRDAVMATLVEYCRVEIVCEELRKESLQAKKIRILIEEEGYPKLGSVPRLKSMIR